MTWNAALPIVAPLLVAVIAAVAWLLRRRLTPERTSERFDNAGKIVDLRAKLSAAGYAPADVDNIIATVENDRTGTKVSAALKAIGAVSEGPADAHEPEVLHTTAAMGARVEARLNAVDAEIERVLLDIEIVTAHQFHEMDLEHALFDPDHVRKMHRAWKLYRRRAAESAAADYAGGSFAAVAGLLEEARVAEGFLKDMTERFRELSSR